MIFLVKRQDLKNEYNLSGTFLDYTAVISAIPKDWKKLIHERSCKHECKEKSVIISELLRKGSKF